MDRNAEGNEVRSYLTKQLNPRIKTVLGGYHATLSYDTIEGSPGADYWDLRP